MKVGFLGPGAYAARVRHAGWPVPPELCDREIAAKSYQTLLGQYQLADELGFDWISVSEHHFAPHLMTPNPVVVAAAASQRTKRVRIALLGPLIPLANPVRLAEEVAMLDSINGGRTVVLFLRGTPNEHRTYTADGAASPHTREITQEGTRLILKAWQEPQPFSWRGEHFNYEHVSVWPRPLQEPHPPVFFSGNSFESIEFAAAEHLNIAIGFAPPPHVAKLVAHYRDCAQAAGWSPGRENVLYRAIALVTRSDEQAASIIEHAPQPAAAAGAGAGAPSLARPQFVGTPRVIAEQVGAYRDAGVGILDLAFPGEAFGEGGTRAAMETFAGVLPQVQEM